MKTAKIDVRLTEELDAWLAEESKRLTISKSGLARMLLEQHRIQSKIAFAEDQARYFSKKSQPPKKNKKGAA